MSKSYRDRNLRYENTGRMKRGQLEKAYRSVSFQARKSIREIQTAYPKAIEVAGYKKDFKPLKRLGDLTDEQLRQEVLRASNFLHSQFGSLESYQQYREKSLSTLGKYGVNEENFDEYSAFMKKRKDEGLLGLVPSDFWEVLNDIDKGPQFYKRMKALQKMLDKGEISEATASSNVRHWIEQTYDEAYGESEFSRYYISRRRRKGSGSSDF